MRKMSRADVAYIAGICVVTVTINPFLKSIGLLPADVFRSYGVYFPGSPQLVFGPLMAFLLLLGYVKTGEPLLFPCIGILRALALGLVFPANPQHLGTGLAGILAGWVAAGWVKDVPADKLWSRLPLLGGFYAGSYAVGEYITRLLLGPAAQTRVIVLSAHWAIGVVLGALVLGLLAGLAAHKLMRWMHPRSLALGAESPGAA